MLKRLKLSKEMLLLIIGSFLILGSIVGGIILLASGESDTTREEYFQTGTAIAAAGSSSPSFTDGAGGQNATAIPQTEQQGSYLDFSSYFVHVEPGSDLESPAIPDRIVIPSINLDAPVVVAEFNFTEVEGETFGQWLAPSKYAGGWHPNSAPLGRVGNTVINGHHNEFGKVFEHIVDLKVGDEIIVFSNGEEYHFVVANEPMKLLELYTSLEQRIENARWLGYSDDVRLTLVTCWPPLANTYRVIVVARPKENSN
jgi:sortase (surface protein transpeptidase)